MIRYAPRPGLLKRVSHRIFYVLDIRLGSVQKVTLNARASVPAYLIELDFGDAALTRRLKQSSAQLTDRYAPADEENPGRTALIGKQLIAITNFPKKYIGLSFHFLILGVGAVSEAERGTVVLSPTHTGAERRQSAAVQPG